MTTLRQAAQQALEALESLFNGQVDAERGQRCSNSITALRAALAEQPAEQEPVTDLKAQHRHEWFRTGAMEPGQMRCITCGIWGLEAPQPRKRLTDEEIDALELPPSGTATVRDLVRLIERAHGIGEQE